LAEQLFASGALWNSFLFAVRGSALLRAFGRRLPELTDAFMRVHAQVPNVRAEHLEALYEPLEARDFSRDVLQGEEPRLRLEIVPPCGWTDLGTPARVEACLASLRTESTAHADTLFPESRAALDLALALSGFAAKRGATAALSA
jgi:mannose-1-phosphate guanylyltransferase